MSPLSSPKLSRHCHDNCHTKKTAPTLTSQDVTNNSPPNLGKGLWRYIMPLPNLITIQ